MKIIDCPSPNYDQRRNAAVPDTLVLHYTGMKSAAEALARLTNPAAQVSSHYFIDEAGTILQLVAERHRAWHAGVGWWQGRGDINSHSIGIEIVNRGHEWGYESFPQQQIAAVIELCRAIVARHRIAGQRVIAHSDLAPCRKLDPGELFPWPLLAQAGVGLYPQLLDPHPSHQPIATRGDRGEAVAAMQSDLARYGWSVGRTGTFDAVTWFAVVAFQRHFRPYRIDGQWDHDCASRLSKLLQRVDGFAWVLPSA